MVTAGFPEPSLKILPSQTLVNDSVTIICNSSDTQPPGISLQIKIASGRTLVSGNQLSLQSTLIAEKEDNEREFMCEAEWGIGGETILKQTSANLTVFCEYRTSLPIMFGFALFTVKT